MRHRSRLRALATRDQARVAWAAYLAGVCVVAGGACVLRLGSGAEARAGPGPAWPEATGERARVVLIVIDALRADTALDPTLMPALARLAREGSAARARVETIVPSTVAGIQALVTGRVVGPASFLDDFGAAPASDGGLLAAARAAGRRVFVAGPALWTDLYGRWIDTSVTTSSVAADDGLVLTAALSAITTDEHDLVVLHLAATDDAAHRAGRESPDYRRALASADQAVAAARDRLGAEARLVVTSDHGVTASGGHAGADPDVVSVPVVLSPGAGVRLPAAMRQRDVPALVAALLGVPPSSGGTAPPPPRPASALAIVVAAALVAGGSLRVLARGAAGLGPAAATFWAAVGATFVAAELALVVAATVLVHRSRRARRRAWLGVAVGASAGVALVALRVALDEGAGRSAPASGPSLVVVLLAALASGGLAGVALRHASGRARREVLGAATGAALAAVVVALGRALGEGSSLSTLDVRAAFALADGALGLVGAGAAVVLRHALVPLAVVAGLAPALGARGALDGLARALAAALAVQALAFTSIYALGCVARAPEEAQRWCALGLGGLVRLALEVTVWFPALALARAGASR